MTDINSLQRENIRNLRPYATARADYRGNATIYLDANENGYGSPLEQDYNRYPDPQQTELKQAISGIKGVPPVHIFIGNGSDEAIDLLIRAFCNPGKDNIVIMPPTYGMYEVSAAINDVPVKKVPLQADFQPDLDLLAETIDANTKLVFICSPNNPTGNTINRQSIETILTNFKGLVIVDEAYINYSRQRSLIQELTEYDNLVVLQTFSKAWGLAALRLGMAFASRPVIAVMNKIKPPYNISQPAQQLALKAIANIAQVNNQITTTVRSRSVLTEKIGKLPFVLKIFPSDANFILVKVTKPEEIYKFLVNNGIVVRDRSKITHCEGCLRITIGTETENNKLLKVLETF